MASNLLLKGLRPVHPGELLREVILPALGRPKTEIARLLGVSRQTLYDVLNEKQPVTANLAFRIAKLVGDDADTWLTMQKNYDLEVTGRALAKEIRRIPTLEAAE